MKKKVIHLLFCMFQEQESYSIVDYDSVDDFYAEIGMTLESEHLLRELNVHGTSDLQELFVDYNQNLDTDMSDKEFSDKWL